MRLSTLSIIVSMAIGISILMALGTWQIKRMYWKEQLIARVNASLSNVPLPYPEAIRKHGDALPEYLPIEISGKFESLKASYEFTTYNGRSGWHVFLPFRLDNPADRLIMVNVGFIPYEAKDHSKPFANLSTRFAGEAFSEVNQATHILTGLFRLPLERKPGYFVNDNDPETATYFWRDMATMAKRSIGSHEPFEGWYLDAGLPGRKMPEDKFPIAGTTRIVFPNNHLQYVITWYGLALALLGVGSYFLYARRTSAGDETSPDP